jgi:hypothetical protein
MAVSHFEGTFKNKKNGNDFLVLQNARNHENSYTLEV